MRTNTNNEKDQNTVMILNGNEKDNMWQELKKYYMQIANNKVSLNGYIIFVNTFDMLSNEDCKNNIVSGYSLLIVYFEDGTLL